MTSRPATRGRTGSKKKNLGIEWIGGAVSMPAYVTGEGEPYRPDMLIWLDADGAILGSTVERPGELLPMATDSLRDAIERPIYGRPHRPTRVRVASSELAEVLRDGHPDIEVVCAPTPELDEVLRLMGERLREGGPDAQTYLSPDLEPAAMAAFFKAAAALFRTRPWKLVPDDDSLVSVTIEELGLRDAAISVIGQAGQSLGLVLFAGVDDFVTYLEAAELFERGDLPPVPPHWSLEFEPGADRAPELGAEVAEHGWEVAAPDAYPWLVAMDEDMVARPPTATELTMFEAISLALTNLMAEKKALRAA